MKIAIVKSSTLTKYNRWDPGFFLGQVDGEEQALAVERARRNLAAATARLTNAIAVQTETAARTRRMIEDGEIVPIE